MADTRKRVTAVFRNRIDAERAFDLVRAAGYTDEEIDVLMSEKTRSSYYAMTKGANKLEASTLAEEGLGVGGAVGTAVGAALGAVVAIGTTLAIPGLGIVIAGPIAAALAGGGAGAVTGGVLGMLIGYGIPEENAQAYQEVLRGGGVVVGVAVHSDTDAERVRDLFDDLNGENIVYA